MTIAIWILLVQAILGATDTLYYHEYKLQLAHGDHTQMELKLHALRDFSYAIIIGLLGFATWNGALAWLLLAILLSEIVITLWDFVEEDKVRKLPAGERCMHAIMGIVSRNNGNCLWCLPGLFDTRNDSLEGHADWLGAKLPRISGLDFVVACYWRFCERSPRFDCKHST